MPFDSLFTRDQVPARLIASYLPAIELGVFSFIADAFYTRITGAKISLLRWVLDHRFNALCDHFQLRPNGFRRCLEENSSFIVGFHAIRCGLGCGSTPVAGSPLDILVPAQKVDKILLFLLNTGQFRVYSLSQSRYDVAKVLCNHLLSSPSTLEMTLFTGTSWLTLNATLFIRRVSYVRQFTHVCGHASRRTGKALRLGFDPVSLNAQRQLPCDECPRRPYGPRLFSRGCFLSYRPMDTATLQLTSVESSPEMFSVVCFNADCPSKALMLHYPATFSSSQLLSSLDQYLPWEAVCRGLTNFWPHAVQENYMSRAAVYVPRFESPVIGGPQLVTVPLCLSTASFAGSLSPHDYFCWLECSTGRIWLPYKEIPWGVIFVDKVQRWRFDGRNNTPLDFLLVWYAEPHGPLPCKVQDVPSCWEDFVRIHDLFCDG
ncbi:hypothetical protein K435DRAFT_806426 [Dendrothele bispora CBS 962.96]|uniref:Uncharacterized protein n=1 Tax=Dendrothele bispora (strain CBS 962.96) TaxID=1314807 RepID=A0A4S8L8N9_DENBC|nr:hypothetical protein K435DRAFT_806426 [Dendrothele bispora CBS 962.96]